MGGPATFEGTTYQEGVIAFVLAHVLATRRIGWIEGFDDTPVAVSGETGGAGDDMRVECTVGSFELQAKAGLTGEAALSTALRGIAGRADASSDPVVLAVDRRSSTWIYNAFASDLDRLRDGRTDFLARARPLYDELGDDLTVVRIKAIDVLPPEEDQADRARDILIALLGSEIAARAAWSRLLEYAADVARRRRRVSRPTVIEGLRLLDIEVPPIGPDAHRMNELDFVKQLLDRRHAAAALAALATLERSLPDVGVGADVRYWLAKHRGSALAQLGRLSEAKASALRALEIRTEGVEALSVAAVASLRLGEVEHARDFALRAVAASPEDFKAWGVLAQVRATAGEPLPRAPASVTESVHYNTVLAEIAVVRGDWDSAIEATDGVLATGQRPPEALVLRSIAIFESQRDPSTGRVNPSDDVERLITEALDALDDVHPLKPHALAIRAANWQALGRSSEADQDLALAAELDRDDTDIIRNLAVSKLAARDLDGASRVLLAAPVEADPLLLGIRAQVRLQLGDRDAASRDLDAAVARLGDAMDGDATRLPIAETAIDLGRYDEARRVINELSPPMRERPMAIILEGRLALKERRIGEATRRFRDAANNAGDMGNEILVELATGLVSAGEDEAALQVFSEIETEDLPEDPKRAKVQALMRTRNLAGAQDEIDRLGQVGALPAWALGTAVEIALQRDDPEVAIRHLTDLVTTGHATAHVRLVLAHELIETGHTADATEQVKELLGLPALTGEERMALAEVLLALGRSDEALEQGYRGFRAAREIAAVHRALIGLVFTRRIEIPPPTVVAADTHVRLKDEHSEQREYTVLGAPPYDQAHNEMSLENAIALGIEGKGVGEEVVEHPESTWRQRRWVVEEILPAVVHFARDALAHFEQRFGNEPFLAAAIHVGDGGQPADYVGIIQVLNERRAHVSEAFALHREQGLPLGLIGRQVHASIPDLMDASSAVPDQFGQLLVEWSVPELYEWSVEQITQHTPVVMTRSAVRTVNILEMAAPISSQFELIAPRSLFQELREEVNQAREELTNGRSTIWASESGIATEDVEAGAPGLQQRLELLEREIEWTQTAVRPAARPFQFMTEDTELGGDLRTLIGRSSYDALALAAANDDARLYADDLGLRRLTLGSDRVSSFSSFALLAKLSELGAISSLDRDQAIQTLLRRGYVATQPSASLLQAAVETVPILSSTELERIFATLGNGLVVPFQAAEIVASACRAVALAPVRRVNPGRVAELALPAIASRVTRPVAAALVDTAATEKLRLLPGDLADVRAACRRFTGN